MTLARRDRGLDATGFVVDFHMMEARLSALLAPLEHANLSDSEAFSGCNASAEAVAAWIGENFGPPAEVVVTEVEVEESPGCVARWRAGM